MNIQEYVEALQWLMNTLEQRADTSDIAQDIRLHIERGKLSESSHHERGDTILERKPYSAKERLVEALELALSSLSSPLFVCGFTQYISDDHSDGVVTIQWSRDQLESSSSERNNATENVTLRLAKHTDFDALRHSALEVSALIREINGEN